MSHLDDGQLHMVLDGALDLLGDDRAAGVRTHLRTCPDCRARLETEAAVRGRAHSILEEADPGPLDLPSLEELRAQARHRDGNARRALPHGVALAWAASVILALGVGLYGPELWRRSLAVPPAAPKLERDEASYQERPDRAEDSGAASEVEAPVEEAPPAVPSAAPVEVGEQSDRGTRAEQARARATSPESRAAPEARSSVEADVAAGSGGGAPGRVEQDAGPRRSPEAVKMLGSAPDGRAVPGLPILRVEELGGGMARIRQELPDGDTLVVLHVPLEAGALSGLGSGEAALSRPTAASDGRSPAGRDADTPVIEPPPGWTQVVTVRESPSGAFVFLQARRSREFLRELAARWR